jgi:hypothetical protein
LFGKTFSGSIKFNSVNESTIDGCSVNLIVPWLTSAVTDICSSTFEGNSSPVITPNSSSLSTTFISSISANEDGLT